jgi:hypothetical protein
VTPLDYDYLRGFLKARSGLVLSNDKQYLIESRLMPIVRKHGMAGIGELVGKLKMPGNEALAAKVTEAMTTNESFFFRDKTPFDHFKEVMLPALLKARAAKRHIRIWCAAASTGQEPYSLAMILKEMGPQIAGWRFEIIGTDLSGDVLERAKAGAYTQFEVQRGLPIQMLLKYFTQNARDPLDGPLPHAEPPERLLGARPVRHRLLPQRAHLFRPADQDRRAEPHGAPDRLRRLPAARRRRDGGRPDRRLQAGARPPRPLPAGRQGCRSPCRGAQAGCDDRRPGRLSPRRNSERVAGRLRAPFVFEGRGC